MDPQPAVESSTDTDTHRRETGLARAKHEEEASVTTEARKESTGRGGRLGQDGRDGSNQGQEEGPKRGSSDLTQLQLRL